MKPLSTLFLIALLAQSLPVWAQSETMPQPIISASPSPIAVEPLTDTQLMERILNQNPGLLAAQEALEAARAEQKGMEAELWPLLGVNSQFTAGTTERMSMPVPGIEPSNMSMRPRGLSANLNLTAMYPLFTGGKLQAQVEGAKRRVQQAEAEYASRRLELRREAHTALLTWRQKKAQARLLHGEIERQSEDLRLAEERLALGKEPRYVVLRSRSELSRLQQELNLAQLEQQQQQLELRRLAALPADAVLAEPAPLSLPKVAASLPTPEEAQRLAAAHSPQLHLLEAQLAEAKTRVQIAQASYLPFIYLVGVYEQRIPEMPEMNSTSGAAIDVLISLPVFDGFRRDSELERFRHDAARLLNESTDARNRVQTQTHQFLLQLATVRANLELGEKDVEQREEEYRIARMRYTGGKAILLELLDATTQLRNARQTQIENWFLYEIARLNFEQMIALEQNVASETDPDNFHL